jgi:RNA polymerase sigma-70 factor (ECF subfamily)
MNSMEEVIKRNIDKMFRTAVAVTHSKEDAEDAVSDAFVKLFEKQPPFQSQEHETAWLIRVTVNRCKNILRVNRQTCELDLLRDYPASSPEQQELIELIAALPHKYRLVIHLHYYEGYSTSEIAEMTRQKPGTVREQLTRARRMLKKGLES